MQGSSTAPNRDVFQGGGEMGALIRSHDWAATPLGSITEWPQSLKTAVGIMLGTRHPVFIFWGQELLCLYNDAYAVSLGIEKHPSILGLPALEAWPEAYPLVEPELTQVMAGGEATWNENNLVPITRYGRIEEVYWTYSYSPIHEVDAPNGVGGVIALITETTKSVLAKRLSEEQHRQILNSATDYAIIASDPNGRVTSWNEGARRLLGWTVDEMLGQPVDRFFTPEDVAAGQVVKEMQGALDEGRSLDERWHQRKNGQRFWASGELTPLRDDAGATTGFVKVMRDRTEHRQAEEHQRLMINELNHRVKNTLTTVQALAAQTFKNEHHASETRVTFEGRLFALAAAHDVLTRELWEGAELREIVTEALAPYRQKSEGRFEIDGPEVRLPPRVALAMAMALHELATNAVKYGALSASSGRVMLRWTITPGTADLLAFQWKEAGGPSVVKPSRIGFGTRLIERSLALELAGTVRLLYEPAGVVCWVEVPLAGTEEQAAHES